MNSGFFRLGQWVAAHPWRVLLAWLVVIVVGAWGAHRLPQAAVGGTGGVPGSPSRAASDELRAEFDNPIADPLIVAVSSPHLLVEQDPYLAWVQRASSVLSQLHEVRRVISYAASQDPHLRSADGHVTMLSLRLAGTDNAAQQRSVIAVRAALVPLRSQLVKLDPAARLAVTGSAASDFDVNAWSAAGGDYAERRALPLTLAILGVTFGGLIAAGLPFLMGLATTTVALGAAFVLAELMPVSNLLGNVVTMIGLAIGIDYSLLMLTHYREHAAQPTIAATVAAAIAHSGQTICWSGLTVIIGLLGLLFTPLLETRSVGIGGALVVCISVLAALTLLPAALVLIGPRIEWLPLKPRRMRHGSATARWRRFGEWIVRHAPGTLVVAGACVVTLALPVLKASSAFSNERWFLPRGMESRIGADMLTTVRSDNATVALYAIVRTTDGTAVLAASHLKALSDYADRLEQDPRIAAIGSPVTLQKGLGAAEYTALYQDLDQALRAYPAIGELFLSRDRHAALFQVTVANGLAGKDIEQLTRELASIAPTGPYTVRIGGAPAEHNDFNDYMFRSFPRVFGFVIGATLLLLFIAFRSYLLPVKAVIMNLLAVAAGIGAVVAVFQLGWLNGLVGLERPFTAIPLEVPLMIFCLSFGLSMDYELFLLFRIQREYALDQNNNRATVAGLAAIAPVITGAGLIMAVVFGAFVGADLPVLKMTGVGLCVSVLVDATLIRAFLVPSVMAIAGRWNWHPGRSQGSTAR